MVKPVLIICDVEKEDDGILYDAAEFVRFCHSQCEKKKRFYGYVFDIFLQF